MAKVGRRPLRLVAACAVLAMVVGRAEGQAQAVGEYQVKAAFLYSFAKFVEWPADAAPEADLFVISIVGDDPFGRTLDDVLRDKMVGPRKVVVRRVPHGQEPGPSHIVFISESEAQRLPGLLKRLQGAPVLTVGEAEQFAERGGVVRLRTENNRVRLDINVGVAERAHLRISSELLKLARIVEDRAAD